MYTVIPRVFKNRVKCLDLGMNLMFSFENSKKSLKEFIEVLEERKKKGIKEKSKLFLDSGAFTTWTRGTTTDEEKYLDFINTNSEYFSYFGQIDEIPNDNKSETKRICAEKTYENYRRMIEKMKEPQKLVYTYHIGEPIEVLEKALEWGKANPHIMQLIAIGGLVKQKKKEKESCIYEVLKVRDETYPEVKVHIFGVTTFEYFHKYDLASGDSSNIIRSGGVKRVETPFGRVGFGKTKDKYHYDTLPKMSKDVIDNYFISIGMTTEDVRNSTELIELANIKNFQRGIKEFNERK